MQVQTIQDLLVQIEKYIVKMYKLRDFLTHVWRKMRYWAVELCYIVSPWSSEILLLYPNRLSISNLSSVANLKISQIYLPILLTASFVFSNAYSHLWLFSWVSAESIVLVTKQNISQIWVTLSDKPFEWDGIWMVKWMDYSRT